MNNFKFKLRSKAYDDIEIISDFIAKDNKIAAQELIQKLYKTFELICTQPDCGRKLDGFHDKTVRYFIVKKHYIIFYKKENDIIIILRLLTGYQDICSLL